jgi:hypothetical protein
MAHADGEQQQALLLRAQERLHVGASTDAVFAELAVNTRDLRSVAITVCVAAGTSRADAEKRWAADGEPLLTEVLDGEEAFLGTFLEMAGFFDFHRPLDEREQQIHHLLCQAFNAHGGWPSGLGHQLIRKLGTGRFIDALASMAAHSPRGGAPSPSTYWTHLLAAANMLTSSDDGRVEPILLLCRQHLDQSSTSGTSSSG